MFKDTHLFQETANNFLKNGKKYTLHPIGTKAYMDFWKEERRRIKEGYTINGVRISGAFYNYLNFSPILKTEVIGINENQDGQVNAERVLGFPDFWDHDYEFFDYLEKAELNGEHAMLAGSRSKGKSLKAASLCARNYHHFKKSKSYCFAAKEEYLLKDGIISKTWELIDFLDNYTPWSKRRHENNSEMHRKASIRIKNENGVETIDPNSFMSEVIGVTTGDNINKLRGKRGRLMILEEGGSYPNLNKGINILRPSMEEGNRTFGTILICGTGGDESADFSGFEEIFNNPQAYNVRGVQNIWDEGMEHTKVGFFFPAYCNYAGTMDKDGNSDIEKAKRIIQADRKLVAQGADPHALTRRKAELPFTPREMMMRISGTLFPIDELKQQEAEIISHPATYKNADYIGRLELNRDTQEYDFVYDSDTTVIYQFPLKDNKNLPGGICIYEHPKRSSSGSYYTHRYCAGIDSYDFDESTTTSLGSCFIMDLWSKRIVAEYTGRPKTADEFYENCRRLCLYYNATANIENANKGIFKHFDDKGCGYLLMEEPRVVRETLENTSIKNNSARRRRGTTPSKSINAHARGILAKWFLTPTNNPDKPEELHVHTFRCLPAIREAVLWNIDGNFDRISALGMLMLAMEDREKYNEETTEDHKTLAQDPWFLRNYRKK